MKPICRSGRHRLSVKGAIANSVIRAGHGITSVSAGQLLSSRILAGVDIGTSTLPSDVSAFSGSPTASIGNVTLRGGGNLSAFSNSLIIAPTLKTVVIGSFNPADATSLEGIAAAALTSATFTLTSGERLVTDTPYTNGNFAVRVL